MITHIFYFGRTAFGRCRLLIILLILLSFHSEASHIFGGDFSMVALPTQGRYRLVLNVYADASTLQSGNNDQSVTIFLRRRKDNLLMGTFVLLQATNTPIVYQNVACAGSGGLQTQALRYSLDIALNPNLYNDVEGYYGVWERCCRTDGVDNLANQGKFVGMVFMLEFPAISQNGQFFKNSSPVFEFPNGDYICVNKPFAMSMQATDADGDELRYSLVTPLQGFTTDASTNGSAATSRAPFPPVLWATNVSLNNVIEGNPPLAINATTGLLTVKATQLGRYAFAILVEEYRNGVKIGSVRRDFQLKVIDCMNTPPPVPTVFKGSNLSTPAATVEICEGETVELTFNSQPNISYQWIRNGNNLLNQKNNRITVSEAGNYQVSASFSNQCSIDTVSQMVNVIRLNGPLMVVTDSLKLCKGGQGVLQATNNPTYQYNWAGNGQLLTASSQNTLSVTQEGRYIVSVTSPDFVCSTKDTAVVIFLPTPNKPTLSASKKILCMSDSINLITQTQTGFSNEWLRAGQVIVNNKNNHYIREAGVYQVRFFKDGCDAISDTFRVFPPVVVDMVIDSIAPFCLNTALKIPLKATPLGGVFSGKGVENQEFDVGVAGAGRHTVVYEVKTEGECIHKKTTIVQIYSLPEINLTDNISVGMGSAVVLPAAVTATGNVSYEWVPPTDLNDAKVQRPVASPVQTVVYKLTVKDGNSCSSVDSIRVLVFQIVYPPDAFSPNNDQINDVWEIKNIDKYPNAEVTVYNRWGEVIFYEKDGYKNPWDGTYNGTKVVPGEYTYLLRLGKEADFNEQRGKVMVLR